MKEQRIPPLNALRAFEAAARHLSFAAAAEELCVTPAAISHQIKSLEGYLGVPLFQRINRRVILTDQGQFMLPGLKQGFGLIEKALSHLSEDGESGLLTVSANPAFTAKWLLPRIHLFQERHPKIDVRLDAEPALADFHKGKVDVAVRFGSGQYPGLESKPIRPLMREKIFPVCSPALLNGKRPLRGPEDLRFHTLLHDETLTGENVVPDWATWLTAAGIGGVDPRRGLRFNNSVLAIEAAINGQGVALGCSFVVADDLAAGRLVRPFAIPCVLEYSYFLVYPRSRSSKKVQKFHEWLTELSGEAEKENQASR